MGYRARKWSLCLLGEPVKLGGSGTLAGDFQTLLAYALLPRAQNQPLLKPARLRQLVLPPG
jgi:hypothetical protein